jgi:general secretion pathway protein N
MICRGTLLTLTAGIVAFGGVRGPAAAATDLAAVNPPGNPISMSFADPTPGAFSSGARVAQTPSANPQSGDQPSGNPLWAVPLRLLSVSRDRPLFSPSRRPPPAAVAAAPYVPPPPPAEVAKPAEPYQPPLLLVGTIVGETESIGVFVDQVTREVVRLRAGQGHAGWTLRSIRRREATFGKGTQKATLALPLPGVEPAGQTAVVASSGTLPGDRWSDGDGQIIGAPPNRTPQPVGAPPVVSSVGSLLGDRWTNGDGQIISPPPRSPPPRRVSPMPGGVAPAQ